MSLPDFMAPAPRTTPRPAQATQVAGLERRAQDRADPQSRDGSVRAFDSFLSDGSEPAAGRKAPDADAPKAQDAQGGKAADTDRTISGEEVKAPLADEPELKPAEVVLEDAAPLLGVMPPQAPVAPRAAKGVPEPILPEGEIAKAGGAEQETAFVKVDGGKTVVRDAETAAARPKEPARTDAAATQTQGVPEQVVTMPVAAPAANQQPAAMTDAAAPARTDGAAAIGVARAAGAAAGRAATAPADPASPAQAASLAAEAQRPTPAGRDAEPVRMREAEPSRAAPATAAPVTEVAKPIAGPVAPVAATADKAADPGFTAIAADADAGFDPAAETRAFDTREGEAAQSAPAAPRGPWTAVAPAASVAQGAAVVLAGGTLAETAVAGEAGGGWRLSAEPGPVQGGIDRAGLTPAAILQTLPPQQMAVQISRAMSAADRDRIEIRLDPPELGRVQIQLATVDGALQASVLCERPETQEFLRRHAEMLARELNEAGYSGVSLSFSTGGETGTNEDAPRGQFRAPDGWSREATGTTPLEHPQRSRVAGGLDIRL